MTEKNMSDCKSGDCVLYFGQNKKGGRYEQTDYRIDV